MSASGAVRAVVLSGEGLHFCSGMDLSVFSASGSDVGPAASDAKHTSRRG